MSCIPPTDPVIIIIIIRTYYFTAGSKLTFSTNLFYYSLLAPTWNAFSDYN